MDCVLNEITNTVHKHELGEADFQTTCGAISTVAHENLRMTSIESPAAPADASKCGRCFEDGRGY